MPLLVENELEDGTVNRGWWENHLWRTSDTISYKVASKPIRITLDPDGQTMDVDLRNNTTKMDYRVTFAWPEMRYNPRDKIVYKCLPSLFYNEHDGYAPGVRVDRSYGDWEKKRYWFNYALNEDPLKNKNNFYWSYLNVFKPIHSMQNTRFKLWSFSQPGLQELGAEFEKKWSKIYRLSLIHI